MMGRMASVFYTNAAYFPNSRLYQGDSPGMLNYSCINQVYYAFASVSSNGTVFLSDEWADARAPVDGVQGGLGSLMHLKQIHPHLRVILSIGGEESAAVFSAVANSALYRHNFAQSALGLVEASGLDGIDICWEFPCDAQQGHDFVALVAAVRMHMPEDRFIVSAVVPASIAVLELIDFSELATYVNFFNLRAFDFFGEWSSRSGYHAQLFAAGKQEMTGSSGVSYLISKGVKPKKILIGIPTHGRSFLAASSPGQEFRGVGGHDGSFDYNQLPRKGCKEVIDKRHVAASCVGADGGFVSYDNQMTVAMKAAYCRKIGLGGLFYWNAPADSREPSRSLVAAGFAGLHSSRN